MRRGELDYELPPELIAQHPCEPRDASRLLVLHRCDGRIEHRRFRDLPEYLRAGDVLVLNDTRVVPARLRARRATGGRVEVLFLRAEDGDWRVLLRAGGRLAVGESLRVETGDGAAAGPALELVERLERGEWRVRPTQSEPAAEVLARFGETPLPPYIERGGAAGVDDRERYQTVYAAAPGAVAAPTAGLHFTPGLLETLGAKGVRRAAVTLHVGAGTFQPIEADDLRQHVMHAEWYEVSEAAASAVSAARAAGARVVATGTTSLRVLESFGRGSVAAHSGWTRLFIYPPYTFRQVDALITNFHLPCSTLLALVMAFAGVETTRRAYAEAIRERYRFYSYGDAMLIL